MEFVRPAQQVLRMKNEDGTIFVEAPVMELDLLLSKAQSGTNPYDVFDTDTWLGRFQELLQAELQVEASKQDAYILATAIAASMGELKKKLPESLMQSKPTESTSPNSTPEHSGY